MRFSSKNGRRGGGKTNKIILSVLSAVVAVVILLLLMFNSGIDSLMRVSGYIIVPIQTKNGFFCSKDKEYRIPWCAVKKIGKDIILVEIDSHTSCLRRRD